MKVKQIIFILILMISTLAIAGGGDQVGNGGEVVACRNIQGTLTSIELLDSYEGRLLHNMQLDLGPDNLSANEKAELGIRRLMDRNPSRSILYLKWKNNFFQGVTFVDEALPATPDVDPSIFPAGCGIEQVAIQKDTQDDKTSYDFGPTLTINRPLWDAMSADQKAALIIHEVIYHEATDLRDKSSAEPVRYFNQVIFSNKIKTLSEEDYSELLYSLNFHDFDFYGINTYLCRPRGSKDWKNRSPECNEHNIFSYREQDYKYYDLTFHLKVGTIIDISDGISDISLYKGESISYKGLKLNLEHGTRPEFPGWHDNFVIRLHLAGNYLFDTGLGKLNLTGEVTFGSGTSISSGRLVEAGSFQTAWGHKVYCAKDAMIYIKNSFLVECSAKDKGAIFKFWNYDFLLINPGTVNFDYWEFPAPAKSFEAIVDFEGKKVHLSNWSIFENNVTGFTRSPFNISNNGVVTEISGEATFGKNREEIIVLKSFTPVKNISYRSFGVNFPVAAKTTCPGEEPFSLPVVLSDRKNIQSFISAQYMIGRDERGNKIKIKKNTYVTLDGMGRVLSSKGRYLCQK